jgi:hypothetical protein
MWLYDPRRHFLLWLMTSGVAIASSFWWKLMLPREYTIDIFVAKLTLLGFGAAVLSLRFNDWRETVRATTNKVFDREALARERRLDTLKEQIASGTGRAGFEYLELEIDVTAWHEGRLEMLEDFSRFELNSIRVSLIDLGWGLSLLLVSSISDLSGLVLDPAGTPWRSFSLGCFAASFAPFSNVLAYYLGDLTGSLKRTEERFRRAEQRSRAKLRALGKADDRSLESE